MTDFLDTMAQHHERVRARVAANKQTLLAALRQLGAQRVVITYEGSGDSGQIEGVSIRDAHDNELESDAATVAVQDSQGVYSETGFREQTQPRTLPLKEALEAFLYDWLEVRQPGWEINDGSSGECTIAVDEGHFQLSHTNYFTESYTEGYTL